ncbi:MAG: hypothetical protein L0J17_06965 [Brevibacterium sp.]|nr:hypothetical protein [Brevibacterium sp.]MDN6175117.1 hypothetical protein [Brevibacterium sp.]MDN6188774.1 hypothetical protein [Brevibacterium sp.]MDN6191812.1 hypothetical protein [Brevibacterium sp.]MDN6527617.1 hypothetical protein [Brevibacterium sp.]
MNLPGDRSDTVLIRARTILLDALEALADQQDAVIVIGAQAVYLRTGALNVALAESTKGSDVTLDPRLLNDVPHLESVMRAAGFLPLDQPGSWARAFGIPIDLMVPEAMAGRGRRGARIPPHDKRAARKARGLEAALIDWDVIAVTALDPNDGRVLKAKVAGSAALLIAKLHKIVERLEQPHRLNDKDAHDMYRILRAEETDSLLRSFRILLDDELSRDVSEEALSYLSRHFAPGPGSVGAEMAGRAEEGVGFPDEVAMATSILASDLIDALSQAGYPVTAEDDR